MEIYFTPERRKNMKIKKLLCTLLALCLLGTMLPVAVFATEGEPGENTEITEPIDPCEDGHAYESVTVEATCTEDGYVRYPCTKCVDTYLEEDGVTPALGHEYVDGVCIRCGDVEFKVAAPVLTTGNIPATGYIHLNWEAVEGAVKYHVYCSQDKGKTYELLATVSDTELTHSAAALSKRYDYYVVTEGERGCLSVPSESVMGYRTPAQPVLTIEETADGKIMVYWDYFEGVRAYDLYYSYDGENYYDIGWEIGNDEDNEIFDKPAMGETIYFKLRAEGNYVADAGVYPKSAFSEPVSYTSKLATPQVTVSTVESTGLIQISWEPVEGATQYKVYRSTTCKTGSWSRISTTTKTTVTNAKNMVLGKTYYYKVIAIAENAAGNSDYSEQQSAVCTLPQPVVKVTYDSAKNGAKISWEPIEGAVQYKVYRSTSGRAGTWSRISTTTATTVTNVKNFDKNGRFYYKVIAIAENTAANSAYSEAAVYVGKLAQPVVTLSNIESNGKIKVSWTAVEGATSYKVYRATSKSGTYSLLITTKNTSINNTSTTAGKTYYYKVMAVAEDASANSDYSAVQSLMCDLARPTTTAGLNTKGQPRLTWKAVDGAVSYKIYRATTKNGTYKLMKTTTDTSYVNTSVTTYETYYYKVVAVASNTEANSAYSVAKGIASTSVNITPSKLNKDFVARVNEYREYFGIDALEWHKDGELTCRTRAAEYRIDFSSDRPDGRSSEKMLEAGAILLEVGLQADATAEDVVDALMYYDDYEDYAAILMYDGWDYAVVACNNGYWCIMFG